MNRVEREREREGRPGMAGFAGLFGDCTALSLSLPDPLPPEPDWEDRFRRWAEGGRAGGRRKKERKPDFMRIEDGIERAESWRRRRGGQIGEERGRERKGARRARRFLPLHVSTIQWYPKSKET